MTGDPAKKATRGELWALGMVLSYAASNLFDRIAVSGHTRADPLVGPLLRGLPSLILGIVLVWKNRSIGQLQPSSPAYVGRGVIRLFIWAGVLSTGGLFAYYFAMLLGGVVVTVPVMQSYVIWGSLFAWALLGERMSRRAVAGLGILVAGLVALPIGEAHGQALSAGWAWAVPLALATAVTYGLSGVLWRDGQLRGAHVSTAILLQFIAGIAVAVVVPAVSRPSSLISISLTDALTLLASGVLSGVAGIYCMFTALRRMSVARVLAFSGLTPLVATIGAHFFLHEFLSPIILGGILAISVGVTLAQIFRPSEERQA